MTSVEFLLSGLCIVLITAVIQGWLAIFLVRRLLDSPLQDLSQPRKAIFWPILRKPLGELLSLKKPSERVRSGPLTGDDGSYLVHRKRS